MQDGHVIHGMREIAINLREFPEKVQRKALATVLRKGGRIVVAAARAKVNSRTGRLARSIRVTIVRSRGNNWLTARIVAGRRRKPDDPFYAWMVEGGTEPHEIRPKGKKSLFLAGLFSEVVKHPGADPKPFLGPALDQSVQLILDTMQTELARQVEALGGGSTL